MLNGKSIEMFLFKKWLHIIWYDTKAKRLIMTMIAECHLSILHRQACFQRFWRTKRTRECMKWYAYFINWYSFAFLCLWKIRISVNESYNRQYTHCTEDLLLCLFILRSASTGKIKKTDLYLVTVWKG